jgi:hypothetical protein
MFHVKFTLTLETMPLTKSERKERLGHGAITKIARKTRRTIGHVSEVVRGLRRDPKVEREVARRLELPMEDVFPPPASPDTSAEPASTAA